MHRSHNALPKVKKQRSSQEHADGIRELLNNIRDANLLTRSMALSSLFKLVQEAPAEAVLRELASAAEDEAIPVRRAVMTALGELVKAAPRHAEAVLEKLASAAEDEAIPVRRAVMTALGELVKAAPRHAKAVLGELVSATEDEAGSVRRVSLTVMIELLKVSPEHAEAVLGELLEATWDESVFVRRTASALVEEAMKTVPPEITREVLFNAVKGEYGSVRCAVIAALEKMAKESSHFAHESVLKALLSTAEYRDADVRSVASATLRDLRKEHSDLEGASHP